MRNQKGMTLLEVILAMATLSVVAVMFLHGIMLAAGLQARIAVNEKNLIRFDMLESALSNGSNNEIEGVSHSEDAEYEVTFDVGGHEFSTTGTLITMSGSETENFKRIMFVSCSGAALQRG